MTRVVYESNGSQVGDGVRITRVTDSGQTLEIMVDTKTERFSRIILVNDETQRTIDTFTSTEFTQPGDAIRAEAAYHREIITAMTDPEKISYLLEVTEMVLSARQEKFALIKDALPAAQRRSCHLLNILWTARPRILTYGYISKEIDYISGSYVDDAGIRANIKTLRRALETTDWPIDIKNHTGMGYSLVAPDDWQAPWEQF